MNTPTRPCLGLALNPKLATELQAHLPRTAVLENRQLGSTQEFMADRTQGGLVFVAASTWKELNPADRESLTAHQSWQFLLIAEPHDQDALEYMASGSFLTLMTCPLDEEKLPAPCARRKKCPACIRISFSWPGKSVSNASFWPARTSSWPSSTNF